MVCYEHPDKEAIGVCNFCGRGVCVDTACHVPKGSTVPLCPQHVFAAKFRFWVPIIFVALMGLGFLIAVIARVVR